MRISYGSSDVCSSDLQAGRIRPDPLLPRPRCRQEGQALMSKEKAPRRVADNEALAVGTQIRGSAQKLNLVATLISGHKVEDALNILAFSKQAMRSEERRVGKGGVSKGKVGGGT